MFDLEKFRTGDYYVHLPTQELYDEVMGFLDKNGFVWGVSRHSLNSQHYWNKYKEEMSIVGEFNDGVRYASEQYYISEGYKKLELNTEENMEEKIRKDLITLSFKQEFKYAMDNNNNLRHYKGRIISDYGTYTLDIIDFIDKMKEEYDIDGKEVAEVVINEFELDEIVRQ